MAVNEHDSDQERPEDARIAALYRGVAREEPPERLDRAIRDAARAPFGAPVAERPPPWWHAWRMPVAFAGVAVLSVSVLLVAQREGGAPLNVDEPARDTAAAGRAVESQTQSTAPGPSAADALPSQPSQAAPRLRSLERSANKEKPPAEGELASAQKQVPSAAPSTPADLERAPASSPPPIAEPDRAPAPFEPAAPPVPAPSPPAKFAVPPPAAKPEVRAAPKPAPLPPPPAPAPRAETPSASPAIEERRPAAKPMMRGFGESAAGSAAQRDAAPQAPAVAALIAELEGRAPQQWIERVQLLRAQGRREDADALLRELKRRFPDEALPPDLR